MKSFFDVVSLNRRYVSASLVYLGMTFILLCAVPEIVLYARSGNDLDGECTHTIMQEGVPVTVPGCPEGYACCESTGECLEIE
jgi:hypothetical protein